MSREVHLTGVELATFAGPYDIRGIGDYCGPIKDLSECVSHEGVWHRVMATYPGMDISKQLPTLGDGDATLQDSRGAALVQLPVDHDERLGPPGDTSRLSVVRG